VNRFSIIGDHPVQQLKSIYTHKKEEIHLRLEEFKGIWRTGTEEEVFAELVFCILTPMARGKMCCVAVENMIRSGVLFTGDSTQIAKDLIGARFINKKSAYIVEAREKSLQAGTVCLKSIINSMNDGRKAREWLARNVKGIGYKEASHFLRNIGFEQNLAILDRHILKNLKSFGVVEDIPGSLTKRQYFDIEKRMLEFSEAIHIPMSYLDFVMWYKETGAILK
jgi:N-glycosylase/DNA lyase